MAAQFSFSILSFVRFVCFADRLCVGGPLGIKRMFYFAELLWFRIKRIVIIAELLWLSHVMIFARGTSISVSLDGLSDQLWISLFRLFVFVFAGLRMVDRVWINFYFVYKILVFELVLYKTFSLLWTVVLVDQRICVVGGCAQNAEQETKKQAATFIQ